MSVIHIYGASGSGTSTLGSALQEQFGYTQLDTDDYFWEPTNPPFTAKRSVEDRLRLLKDDMHKSNNVVISGSLCGWGDELIPYFDLVIRLVTPTDLRMARLEEREFRRFGNRIRKGGDMYEEHIQFMQWASEYDDGDENMRSKAMHDNWEKLIKATCRHICLDGTQPIERLLEEISVHGHITIRP